MASERAKQLVAQQKVEAQAAKLRKKHSEDPRDWGTIKQLVQTFKLTVSADPRSGWLIIGAFVAVLIVGTVLGIVFNQAIWGILFGAMMGFSASLLLLTNRAKYATYKRYENQPGSAQVALMMLPKKKWSYTPALTGTRAGEVVHRAIGPAGLILIGEGDPARSKVLLAQEKKRHSQVVYDVEVITMQAGKGEGQVPIGELAKQLQKLPVTMTTEKIAEVETRLRALDGMRQRAPLPKGPLPGQAKGSRKAMRGR